MIFASCLLGFVFLSRYQQNEQPLGIWDTIYRGLGIAADTRAAASPQPAVRTPTNVAWTRTTLDQIRNGNAERGAVVALNCVACHGEPQANPGHLIPTLDGMECGGDLQAARRLPFGETRVGRHECHRQRLVGPGLGRCRGLLCGSRGRA